MFTIQQKQHSVRKAAKKKFLNGSAIKEREGVKAVPLREKKNFFLKAKFQLPLTLRGGKALIELQKNWFP